VAGGQILAFLIDIDRRSYNTLALPCECVMLCILVSSVLEICLMTKSKLQMNVICMEQRK